MPRHPLPIGTWGRISTSIERTDEKGKPVSYRSKARFRDHDDHVRPVTAFGKNKTTAERALLQKLQDRARTNQSGELTAMHKIDHLIDVWEKKFKQSVADGKRSPTSLDNYQGAIKNHIRPALGELRIGEATTQRIDTVITKITERAGAPRAKTCRAILSGMMKLAVRYGAISVNPVREIEAIEAQTTNPPRSLTVEEVTLLRKHLATDERAVQADLPDLVAFMLGTGVRIGEALAVLWSQANLEAATVEVTSTIVRVKGEGLLRKRTKSRAGHRVLHLPEWNIAVLRSRYTSGIRLDDPIFADTIGGFRDPTNVRRSLRTALSPRRQHRPPRPRPHPPSPPPRNPPHPQTSRRQPQLAPNQSRTHRNRPHQSRPPADRRPRRHLRHQTRVPPPPTGSTQRRHSASRLRQARLDPLPRPPQDHRHGPRRSRPHRPPNR
jgi:integrase